MQGRAGISAGRNYLVKMKKAPIIKIQITNKFQISMTSEDKDLLFEISYLIIGTYLLFVGTTRFRGACY